MKFIDRFLNSITMYRLVLYGLSVIALVAIVYGFIGILSFSGFQLIISLALLCAVCYFSNIFLAFAFGAPRNVESVWITAFILFLILAPLASVNEALVLVIAAVLAMASKYIFAIHRKHIFNPAAIAAVILALAGNGVATWWVGSPALAPVVLIVGLLIVRKIRRFSMLGSFVFASVVVMVFVGIKAGTPIGEILWETIASWPLIFFGTIMLTEPLTAPPTKRLQIVYGLIIGAIFSSQFHIGMFYSTPEMALIIGNIFSYVVSSKRKLMLTLKNKTQLSPLVYDFAFAPDHKLDFMPGQYLEWTLPHAHSDDRGNRRYFTIASSPTESEIHLGVRIQQDGSSFKEALLNMKEGDCMTGGSLAGEFTLAKDPAEKLVYIAGGIGVTPFRSMIKYLIDIKEKRDIVLFYACASETDFVYGDIFDQAEKEIGLKVVRVVTDALKVSPEWKGKTGFITKEMVAAEVVDFADRTYYLSGPDAMVQNYKKMILGMGVKRGRVHTDYFPGF